MSASIRGFGYQRPRQAVIFGQQDISRGVPVDAGRIAATNEEFEATNEELQATNEELETNNEELQATNEELQTTNDELTARTSELQELTKQRRVEQLKFASLLERFPHYIMVLSAEDLTIQTVNPAYRQLLGSLDVNGLLMSEIFTGKHVDDLIKTRRTAVHESHAVNTGPILASVDGEHNRTAIALYTQSYPSAMPTVQVLVNYFSTAKGWSSGRSFRGEKANSLFMML